MKVAQFGICAVALAALLGSCNIVNPTERVPYIIKIDSVSLSGTNYQQYGSTKSHKITDVWVYANNNLVGTYEIPAYVPILADSNDVITIGAGILDNGLSAARKSYPMYGYYTIPISWPKSTAKTLSPNFEYFTAVQMPLNWDFETNLAFIPKNSGIDLPMSFSTTTADTYEGVASGVLFQDSTHRVNQIVSQNEFTMQLNKQYYLEMNYKCTMPFEIYAVSTKLGQQTTQLLGGVNPKATWNKIYFNIGALHAATNGEAYKLVIRTEVPSTLASAQINLDNIKMVGIY
jgi:hypothetical protein